MTDVKAIIEEVDLMLVNIQWRQAYEKLKPFMEQYLAKTAESDWDRELIFRWARTLFYFGKYHATKEQKLSIMETGFSIAEKLLSKESAFGPAHLWYAVLRDGIAELDGVRARINTLVPVEEHLRKAAELLPDDPIAQHSLGKFFYELADLPWILRKAVELVYGGRSVPHSSYELALDQFLKADRILPDFYSLNTAYIGKCYVRMKKNDQALPYLTKAAKWEVKFFDDEEAKKDGVEFLKQIGVKNV